MTNCIGGMHGHLGSSRDALSLHFDVIGGFLFIRVSVRIEWRIAVVVNGRCFQDCGEFISFSGSRRCQEERRAAGRSTSVRSSSDRRNFQVTKHTATKERPDSTRDGVEKGMSTTRQYRQSIQNGLWVRRLSGVKASPRARGCSEARTHVEGG